MVGRFALALGASVALLAAPAVASASPFIPGVDPDRAGAPLPLNGRYVVNTALDRQTFNGAPDPATPFASDVVFQTACNGLGCFAHSSMSARDEPMDFRWTGTEWESIQRIDWTCDGRSVPATVTFTLTPKLNGTLAGKRTAVIAAPGCGSPRVPGTVTAPLSAAPA
jgi:hypothetical protein